MSPAEDPPSGGTVDEQLRSAAWKVAKAVALDEWQKGSADTTQMLICASRAVDAALAVAVERAATFCARSPLCLGSAPRHSGRPNA